MFYLVRIAPAPTVVNADGGPVAEARVLEIIFPSEVIDTNTGPINVFVGAGVAKISVDGETIRGVPLC